MNRGTVFHIQRYTIHDGPGIRTELFFKGCPLRCQWCSNPESHACHIQPGVYTSKCIGREACGGCEKNCPLENCLIFQEDKLVSIDRTTCTNCMKCVEACPSDAIRGWGQVLTVDEAMEIVCKDIPYYEKSGGGVTLSGGEPLQQSDFAAELLKCCKEKNIHTCVESTLCMDFGRIQQVIPYTDLFITDLKHMDTKMHKIHTGVGNEKILENIKHLTHMGKPMIVRIPVIPEVNDHMENMAAAADFILGQLDNRILRLQLLEFMWLGEEKYQSLGLPYPMRNRKIDKDRLAVKIKEFTEYFKKRGIPCIGGISTKERKHDT